MRYLWTIALALVLTAPAWSQMHDIPSYAPSITSGDVTLSAHVNRIGLERTVEMSFRTDRQTQTITLARAEWRRFYGLYQDASTRTVPPTLYGSLVVGSVHGIEVAIESTYTYPYWPFGGGYPNASYSTLDTRLVISYGTARLAVLRSASSPLDSLVEAVNRELLSEDNFAN